MSRSLILLFLLAGFAHADWPQWRGPNRDGSASKSPKQWPGSLQLAWKVEVGLGHSGPVLAADRVYTMARVGDEEVIRCLKKTDGSEIWTDKYRADAELDGAVGWHGKMPRATPCVVDGKVYTLGVSGVLTCYAADSGKRLWRNTFTKKYPKPYPIFGAAASPIVYDGLCVVWVGSQNKGALTALDAKTGAEKWTLPLDGPGYASPILTELAGRKQLITQSEKYLLGADPKTGKELWKVEYSTQYDQNSITPLVADGKLLYSGYQKPLSAATLSLVGKKFELAEAWEVRRAPLYMSSPVSLKDRVYAYSMANDGTLFALNPRNGEVVWKKERMGEHASLLRAGDFLLVQTTNGKLHVLAGDARTFAPVATYTVAGDGTWSHPALAGDVYLVKDKTKLHCWRIQ